MMILSNEEIEKMAYLARLSISHEEALDLQQGLSKVLTMIEKMNAIDTAEVQPMSHPMDANQRLRLDQVTEIDQRQLFQSIAPDAAHGLYFVPRVIE